MNTDSSNKKTVLVHNKVKKTVEEHALIKKGDKILVALSGGADSVCLLNVLYCLKDEFNISVAAAHLNHMIRGAEADGDEAYAAELCTRLDIPFYAKREDVPSAAKKKVISEELAGREARYEFFDELSAKYGFDKVATAHNKNDNAETVMMRIIRGTGIDGLCGIKYKRDNIIRPILDITRDEIEGYCNENKLEYKTDSTNESTDYTRNRVRNELLPLICKNFNPSIIDALTALSDNTREDAEFINSYAKRLYMRINSPMPHRKPTVLDIKSLDMIGRSIRNRLYALAAKEVMGDGYKLERIHFDLIDGLCQKETGAKAELPSGLRVSVKYGWLEFATEADEAEKKSSGFCYEIELDDYFEEMDIKLEVVDPARKPEKNQMILDYDLLEDKHLTVRSRKIGDKIVIYKDGRSRKLKDYWIDKKVPRSERDKIPLLCADKEIVAIIGDRVAENHKINNKSKKGLLVTYGTGYENR